MTTFEAIADQGIERWMGCYEARREGLFLRESNAHPAKMAVGLCFRIFEHGRKMGYWKPGDLILDPMCGIFTTAVVGLSLGYRVTGIELEEHFCKLAVENLRYIAERKGIDISHAKLIQGDARRLTELQGGSWTGKYSGAVSSPPYAGNIGGKSGIDPALEKKVSGPNAQHKIPQNYSGAVSSPPYASDAAGHVSSEKENSLPSADRLGQGLRQVEGYGKSRSAQIGNLRDPAGDIDAVVSSLKTFDFLCALCDSCFDYVCRQLTNVLTAGNVALDNRGGAESVTSLGVNGSPIGVGISMVVVPIAEKESGMCQADANPASSDGELRGKNFPDSTVRDCQQATPQRNLAIATGTGEGHSRSSAVHARHFGRGDIQDGEGQGSLLSGHACENSSAVSVNCAVQRNPAFITSFLSDRAVEISKANALLSVASVIRNLRTSFAQKDSPTTEPWQKSKGFRLLFLRSWADEHPTYLSSMLCVYSALGAILKPSAVSVLVTKNPVKKGQIRWLDLDTIRLMEHCGFTLIERQMAMLAEETRHGDLFQGETVRRRERKSFLKRLHERKNPHLRVDHEDVLFFRKMAEAL